MRAGAWGLGLVCRAWGFVLAVRLQDIADTARAIACKESTSSTVRNRTPRGFTSWRGAASRTFFAVFAEVILEPYREAPLEARRSLASDSPRRPACARIPSPKPSTQAAAPDLKPRETLNSQVLSRACVVRLDGKGSSGHNEDWTENTRSALRFGISRGVLFLWACTALLRKVLQSPTFNSTGG